MLDCRRARRRPAFASAPLALAASLFCVALPSASWAQSGAARAAVASAQSAGDKKSDKADANYDLKTALIKAIGKEDGEFFGNLLQTLGDGKSAFHVIAETTAEYKQDGFTGAVSGRTEMRGNYGSAFVTDAEMTVKQGDQSQTSKTKFFCDGQTIWTFKPDANKYTEQTFAAAKPKMADEVMGASFDVAGLLAAGAANGFRKDNPENVNDTYKLDKALFRGVPCRILTIDGASSEKDGDKVSGRFRVYVGLDKRLRGMQLQLRDKNGVAFTTLTEIVKVMEPLSPAPSPQDALFHFSPPAGAKKVDSFEDGDE